MSEQCAEVISRWSNSVGFFGYTFKSRQYGKIVTQTKTFSQALDNLPVGWKRPTAAASEESTKRQQRYAAMLPWRFAR